MKNLAALLLVFLTVDVAGLMSAPEKDPPPDYYPLKLGTKWHYRVTSGGREVQVVNSIAKIEKIDEQSLARQETSADGKIGATEHLSTNSKGVFRHRYNGVEVTPAVCILRYPVKKDESWDSDVKIGEQNCKITCKVLADKEEVEVPAGKYKTVSVKIDTDVSGEKITTTYWFATGVGIVKQTADLGKVSFTMELEKMETPK